MNKIKKMNTKQHSLQNKPCNKIYIIVNSFYATTKHYIKGININFHQKIVQLQHLQCFLLLTVSSCSNAVITEAKIK